MRKALILFLATSVFSGLFLLALLSIQTNSIRTPFYYYPDGYVLNNHEKSPDFLGKYINPEEIKNARRLFAEKNILSHTFNVFRSPGVSAGSKTAAFIFLEKQDIVFDFIWDILISFLFAVTGVFLYYYVRDIYLLLLFVSVALFILFNFFILAFHDYHFPYFIILYFMGFLIFNLSFRFHGKEITLKWFFPQVALAFLIGYIGYQERLSAAAFYKIKTVGFNFVFVSSVILVLTLCYQIYRDRKTFKKKAALIAGMMSVVIVPYILLKYDLFSFENTRQFYIFSYAVFPVLFVYGTFRYAIVPIQFLFNRSLAIVYQIAFYLFLYMGLTLLIEYLIPGKNAAHLLNIIFLITAVYFVEPVHHMVFDLVSYWTFKRNRFLRETLDGISKGISAPISFKATIVSILRIITHALKVNRVMILIPGDKFPKMDPKNIYVMKIPSNSEIWHYLTDSEEIIITSHLAYGSGIRESVYNFLKEAGVQLAYPMPGYGKDKNTAAVFLVGEKNDGGNFTLGELTFIKECTRFAELLLYNYSLLVNDVEKKKLVRDLNYASILDRTLNVHGPIQIENLGFLSLPAVGISGDYIDIIAVGEDKTMIFLGDVVGHGLGSGYLASAIRALIRDQVRSGYSLEAIFNIINKFLNDRYAGDEFMSLIGGIYNQKDGVFEYINAGHLPLILQSGESEFQKLEKTQQVLGILKAEFYTLKVTVKPGTRLIIYSDGIVEAFDAREVMYGNDRFFRFLSANFKLDPVHLAREIEKEMEVFRGDHEQSDDISFICLENKNLPD